MSGKRSLLRRLLSAPRRPIDPEDPDGIDRAMIEAAAPLVERVTGAWFDLDVRGIERIPSGPALLVGNHNSGSSFVEAMGVVARAYRVRGVEEPWHGLAHDKIIEIPVLGRWLHRVGALRANHDSARAVFDRRGKLVVFPGGNREAYRPFRDRYRIAFGDRRGFVKLAIHHGVPIVPMVFVGGHSGFVVLHDGQRFARVIGADRWLRSDTWPLFLGLPFGLTFGPGMHIPLPVQCTTEFLDPIPTAGLAGDASVEAVEAIYELVVTRMQARMQALAGERQGRRWPLRRRA